MSSSNVKVAHFIETEVPGGAEKLLLDICAYSNQHNIDSLVLHFDHPYFKEKCPQMGIQEASMPGREHFKSYKTLWRFAISLRKTLLEQKIDVLHSHLFGPITGAAAGAFLAGKAHIGTLHDIHMIEESPARIRLLQIATLLGTKLFTVSQSMQSWYRERAYFSQASLSTIYNTVKPANRLTQENHAQLKHSLNIEPGIPVLICVGRLVKLKRHDLLLKALQQLPDSNKDYKLLIVGDGPELESTQQLCTSLALDNSVIFTGMRNDVNHLLQISDIFIQCSDTEGLSMSILEALAHSLPCVVTDVGSNAELVSDQENGYLVPADNSQALSHKIATLLNESTLRQQFSTQSLDLYQRNFAYDDCMQKYLSAYHSLS